MKFFRRLARFSVVFFKLFHTLIQMVYGAWRITSAPRPVVTIFGGARFIEKNPYSKKAGQLAQMCVDKGISVLTGGGPGIMEAASCGARHTKPDGVKSIGIGVRSLGEKPNPCVQEYFELDYFFSRKWLMIQYATAFVVFPGGYGTLDELAEVLTLMQTNQIKAVPIVLIGKEFWEDFLHWMDAELIPHGAISKENLQFFNVTDDIDEAFCWIVGKCELR